MELREALALEGLSREKRELVLLISASISGGRDRAQGPGRSLGIFRWLQSSLCQPAFLSLSHHSEQRGTAGSPPLLPKSMLRTPGPALPFLECLVRQVCQVALVRSCQAEELPTYSRGSGDTPRLQIQGAHGQHPVLHSGEWWWGWSWAFPRPNSLIAPISLMLGRGD